MFLVLSVQGCLPYLNLEKDLEAGEVLFFSTYEEAEKYAKENCAWEYKIIEW